MAEPVRVLIADDSAFVRRAVMRMLEPNPDIEVVGTATTGAEALRLTKTLHPDVVILDVNMPELDGLEALQRIMEDAPTGVLMLSTQTKQGARTTLTALELGAVDFLDKTSAGTTMDIYALAPLLREKVLAAAGATVRPLTGEAESRARRPEPPPVPGRTCPFDLVVIGASTGGPRALAEVVSSLPADLGAGVVIAQHMPSGFTQTLADRLDRRSALSVREARDGSTVRPGEVLVAPGGRQARIAREGDALAVRVDDGPSDLLHRPSVDLLFRSAAEAVGSRAVGVVLTGMGDDGALGLRALHDAGAVTFAESESTAVIYGMPRAAAAVADRVLPLPEVGPAVVALCSGDELPGAGRS